MTDTHQDTTRRLGAQPGNQNRHRHGLRAGTLPKGCRYIARQGDELRQHLESAVLESMGEIAVTAAAAINTALRAERLAALASRWLRLHAAEMSHDQRLSYAREVLKASEARDRAIRSLGLGVPSDPHHDLYTSHGIDAAGLDGGETTPEPTFGAEPPAGQPEGLPGMAGDSVQT